MPAMDIYSMRFGGPIRMAWCSTSGPFTVLVPSMFSVSSVSSNMNATLAQQLCRQHVIAGEHMLENAGPQAHAGGGRWLARRSPSLSKT